MRPKILKKQKIPLAKYSSNTHQILPKPNSAVFTPLPAKQGLKP
jgi:hypothetical protein